MSIHITSRASHLAAILASLTAFQAQAALDPTSYSSLGSLNLSSSTLTFDTDTLQITGGPLHGATGVLQSQGGLNPSIAVFTFSDVQIGSGVSLQIVGSRPVAILSQSNLRIDANLFRSGSSGASGPFPTGMAPAGLQGQNGMASTSGGIGGAAPVAAEPGGKGGNGGYNSATGQTGSIGSGSAAGGPGGASSGSAATNSDNGQPGNNGSNGFNGGPGTGGSATIGGGPGFILRPGANGTNGNAGTNGRGGGGGGGGGGGSNLIGGFPAGTADTGGGGGSGGAGGVGGQAGNGGSGGGAIQLAAVYHLEVNGNVTAYGGNGGNGAPGQLGGPGAPGGLRSDTSGAGGRGGDGGDGGFGGPGGGGAGGTIQLAGAFIHGPASTIGVAGSAGGFNSLGATGGTGGAGLFRFEGTLVFDVDSASSFDKIVVNGNIDPQGGIHFSFSNDAIADDFAATFTFDDFISRVGATVSLTPYLALDYTASSPTREFEVTLHTDRTFSLVVVPEPAMLSTLAAAGTLLTRRRRACR